MTTDRTTSQEVTNVTGAKLTTSVILFPTVEDVLSVLSRAVAREKRTEQYCYVSPSDAVRNAIFRFTE